MAALSFPFPAVNGQLYPDPPTTDVNVYRYEAASNTWRLLGSSSGVTPGTYGTDSSTLQVFVDPTGVITNIVELAIRESSVTQTGIVQLNDTLESTSITEALTANQGRELYDLIINGAEGEGVTFINIDDISTQFDGTQTSFLLRSSSSLLPTTLTDEELFIVVGGILQSPGANYAWNPLTSVVTFTSAPLPDYDFGGRYFTTIGNTVAVINGIDDISSQFNGTRTNFPLTTGGNTLPSNTQSDNLIIEVGGVNQEPNVNWSFSPGTSAITFTAAPDAGFNFSGRFASTTGTSTLLQTINNISTQFNGVETNFFIQTSSGILPPATASAQLLIFLGGILQTPGINYVYNSNSAVLSFSSPPYSGWAFDGRVATIENAIPRGTVTSVNTGEGLSGGPITTDGTLSLNPSTISSLGGVKPDGISCEVSLGGTLSLLPATTATIGGVIADGATITISPSGVISTVSAASLWSELGGILFPSVAGSPVRAIDFSADGAVRAQAGNTGVYAGFKSTAGVMQLFASSSVSDAQFQFYASESASQSVVTIGTSGNVTIGGTLSFNVNGTNTSLTLPVNRGVFGQILTSMGDGNTFWDSPVISVGTLQQVTSTGNTTTNTMRFFDSVTSAEAVRIEPDISQITLYPQTGGDPGLAINSNSVAFSDSTGAVRASGIFPSELTFRGSLGLALQTVGPTVPVGLWAGGLSGAPAPQVSVTGTSTTISNQLVASNLSYPTADGTAGQVLSTNGSGTLSWASPSSLVSFHGIDNIASQFNGITTTFALTSGASPLPTGLDAQQLLISLSGVLQYPGDSYSYAASSITFTSAPLASYTFNGRYLGPS